VSTIKVMVINERKSRFRVVLICSLLKSYRERVSLRMPGAYSRIGPGQQLTNSYK